MDLQRDPFSREPDSLFYCHFDSIDQRLNILDGLVKGKDLFVLVIGDPGSGKTTMLNRYLASIESEWTSARIQVDHDSHVRESSLAEGDRRGIVESGKPTHGEHGQVTKRCVYHS